MTWRHLLPFLRPPWRHLAAAAFGLLASTAMGLIRPWPLKLLFDWVLVPGHGSVRPDPWLVVGLGVAIVALALGDGFFSFIKGYFLAAAGHQMAFSLRVALFGHIQQLAVTARDRRRTGDLVARVTADVDRAQGILTEDLLKSLADILLLVGMVGVMATLDWQLAAVVMATVPVLLVVVARYRTRLKAESRRLREREGEVVSMAHEVFAAGAVIQALGQERRLLEYFARRSGEVTAAGLRLLKLSLGLSWLVDVSTACGTALVITVGTFRVLSGALTPGDLLVFVSYTRDFYGPLRALARFSGQVSKATACLDRIAEVLTEAPAVQETPDARPAPRFRGSIRFERVTFGYDPAKPVLTEIDFAVEAGQRVAIVGPTGAGKTTLISLVLRLYDPQAGRVLIDGRDIRDFTLSSLRSQVAVVPQETVLFRASVWENLAYGRPEATRSQLVAAARAVGADEFILRLPAGYDTVLGERGCTLSGGQRQKLAIARALVRNAPILILDEPTAGLDPEAEADVMAAVRRLMAGRTTLLVTHRLTLAEDADLIVVLDGGRILECGRHPDLLRRGGLYARLYRLQRHPSPNAAAAGP